MKDNRGFTLIEMLIASGISLIALGGVITLFLTALETWTVGAAEIRLERNGRLLLEKIVRGPNGQAGLREAAASSVTIDADQAGISFLVDKNSEPTSTIADDTTVRIYLDQSNQRVVYDPDTSLSGNAFNLNRDAVVDSVIFAQSGNMVSIDLQLTDTVGTTQQTMQTSFQTSVFLRKD